MQRAGSMATSTPKSSLIVNVLLLVAAAAFNTRRALSSLRNMQEALLGPAYERNRTIQITILPACVVGFGVALTGTHIDPEIGDRESRKALHALDQVGHVDPPGRQVSHRLGA